MSVKCESDEKNSNIEKFHKEIPAVVRSIVKSCREEKTIKHIDSERLPSRKKIIEIIDELGKILFPGYFDEQRMDNKILDYHIGNQVNIVFDSLAEQVSRSLRHECSLAVKENSTCVHCVNEGYGKTLKFLKKIPVIRKILAVDVKAAFDGDPAAKSNHGIVFSYPCIKAITMYRIAHELCNLDVPLIPRIISEYAHSITGIDIHPGARIGRSFFIDHGTGVVIGETTIIGNNVKIYQGVTLGALSVSKDSANLKKRHPTIKDNVTIYSGATILGGDTVIGKGSVIGGNVWLTSSVPAYTKVTSSHPELTQISIKNKKKKES